MHAIVSNNEKHFSAESLTPYNLQCLTAIYLDADGRSLARLPTLTVSDEPAWDARPNLFSNQALIRISSQFWCLSPLAVHRLEK